MKTERLMTLLAVAAISLLLCPLQAWSAEPGQTKLTYEAGNPVARLLTPVKALTEGHPFQVQGAQGRISVAGTNVLVGAQHAGNDFAIGMDLDGSGAIDRKELAAVGKTRSVSFDLKIGASGDKKDYSIALTDLRFAVQGNAVAVFMGKALINCCRKGTVNGVEVRILDDNMDGKFTQDGLDAIAIGTSPAALPLRAVHQIGSKICRLEVAEDGSTLTATPLSDVKLGVVDSSYKTAALKCLILSGKEGAFDVAASGRTGIPAGEYKLAYGVLASGQEMVAMVPTTASPTYAIEADKLNTIRIGAPLKVQFAAAYADNKVTVSPAIQVVGAGGERYPMDFNASARPHVLFMNGESVLSDNAMEFG